MDWRQSLLCFVSASSEARVGYSPSAVTGRQNIAIPS